MTTTFLHTADWQLGKPFAGVEDVQKRSILQQERLNVVDRIAVVARSHQAEFVVVAGDLFDSPRATKSVVSAACSAIGRIGLPVFVIPGNHDHAGPGSIWEQSFFKEEARQLGPNLRVLLTPEPVELASCVVFPCPLLRRHEANDPTAWLRAPNLDLERFGDKVRLVLAHGSVQGFGTETAEEEESGGNLPNQLDLSRLPAAGVDYLALGDWHGTKQVGPNAWYAGTPELDRFPKGGGHDPGNVLVVTARPGEAPEVKTVRTGRFEWHELIFPFADDSGLAQLELEINTLTGARAGQDLLRLEVRGSLGIEATMRLEGMLDAWQARLLRLKLSNSTVIAPSEAEIQALTQRASDPLISCVAAKLVRAAAGVGEEAAAARLALRELHAACVNL